MKSVVRIQTKLSRKKPSINNSILHPLEHRLQLFESHMTGNLGIHGNQTKIKLSPLYICQDSIICSTDIFLHFAIILLIRCFEFLAYNLYFIAYVVNIMELLKLGHRQQISVIPVSIGWCRSNGIILI